MNQFVVNDIDCSPILGGRSSELREGSASGFGLEVTRALLEVQLDGRGCGEYEITAAILDGHGAAVRRAVDHDLLPTLS